MVWNESLITLAVLAVPICVVNFLFVMLVIHRGFVDKLQNALLISLGCSDFCAGFFAIPCSILCTLVTNEPRHCELCIGAYLLNRFIMISSILHLTAVIYERYLKIIHPFWFQSMEYTLLRSTRVVPTLWVSSLVISCVPLTWWPLENPCDDPLFLRRNLEYFDYACLALFILLLMLMIYAFIRLFLVVRMHLHDINTTAVQLRSSMDIVIYNAAASTNSPSLNLARNSEDVRGVRRESDVSSRSSGGSRRQVLLREARIVTRFAAMLFIFITVWGTYFYLSTQEVDANDVSVFVIQIFSVIRFINPLVDPWILTVNNKNFRLGCNFWKLRSLSKWNIICCSCFGERRKSQSSVPEVAIQVSVDNELASDRVV